MQAVLLPPIFSPLLLTCANTVLADQLPLGSLPLNRVYPQAGTASNINGLITPRFWWGPRFSGFLLNRSYYVLYVEENILLILGLPSVMWTLSRDGWLFIKTLFPLSEYAVVFRKWLPSWGQYFSTLPHNYCRHVISSPQQNDNGSDVCLFWTKTFRRWNLFLHIAFSFSKGRQSQTMEVGYVPEPSSGGEPPTSWKLG